METQTNITKPRTNVGYFFLCLGVLVTLITSVVSFLNLVFETLNKHFPDVLNASYEYGYSTYQYEGIRTALATLIIVFPVFLVVSYFWNKFSQMELGRLDEMFKKWVVYIILFLSSLVVIGDLVTLVRYFISGEITSRFIYKVLTVLVVALLVGFRYGYTLKEQPAFSSKKLGLVLGGVGIILVVGAICYSFSILGSPAEQRQLRLDDRSIQDLQTIQYQVINFWQQKEKLPATLGELSDPFSGWSLPVEPEFEKGKTYEYSVKGPLQFELCATFSQPMPKGWREFSYGGGMPYPMYDKAVSSSYPYPGPGGGTNESWSHDVGRTCFIRTIDKDMYPPYPKPLR
ncbi:MAG: DUF5671 domain-containing protein [bacterium]|nr:DUF5671 domain-containing protein [bacterium]